MSTSPSLTPDASQSSVQRLKLKLTTPPAQNQADPLHSRSKEESSSPVRPSYSPVTPTFSHVALNTESASQQWINEPVPLPLSLDDNPDAIALRATISLLQMQRQQTLRDIRSLDKTKKEAIVDPEGFVNDLRDGRLKRPSHQGITFDDDDDDDDDEKNGDAVQNDATPEAGAKFRQLPDAQHIARCPPIEWSKYHIAGEPLDRLHELQKHYPGLTEESLAKGIPPQPHEITAPYRPFVDKIKPHHNSFDRQFDG